jgi:phosphatidylglycerol lysyltransferase
MDFLIASTAVQFKSEGAEIMSLGLSPLADSDEDEETDSSLAAEVSESGTHAHDAAESEWLERLRGVLFERFNQFYRFKGLNAFKAKFAPGWEPRYMVFPRATHLPTVAYAVVRAHASRRFRYLIGFKRKSNIGANSESTSL